MGCHPSKSNSQPVVMSGSEVPSRGNIGGAELNHHHHHNNNNEGATSPDEADPPCRESSAQELTFKGVEEDDSNDPVRRSLGGAGGSGLFYPPPLPLPHSASSPGEEPLGPILSQGDGSGMGQGSPVVAVTLEPSAKSTWVASPSASTSNAPSAKPLDTAPANLAILHASPSRSSLRSNSSAESGGALGAGKAPSSGSQEGGYSPGQALSLPSWHVLPLGMRGGMLPDQQSGHESSSSDKSSLPQASRASSARGGQESHNFRSIYDFGASRGTILSSMDHDDENGAAEQLESLPIVTNLSVMRGPREVTVEELLQCCQEFPAVNLLSGSTSTARFSLRSAESGFNVDGDLERVASKTVKLTAFNSTSIMAPRSAMDNIEVRKRLKGGFTLREEENNEDESGVHLPLESYYPTANERRVARELELQNEAKSRKVLCPGLGLLWSHPSIDGGIPYPFDVLEVKYKSYLRNSGVRKVWYADPRCRGRTLQFLLSVQQYLPSMLAELCNAETISVNSVNAALDLTEELVAASHRDSCPHARIRILLTQLLVQLMDTLVLLEEPERFVQEFSKVNETELIDLLGDVSLSQQATHDDVQRDLTILIQTMKKRQANLLLYILLMMDNCIWLSAVELRTKRSAEANE